MANFKRAAKRRKFNSMKYKSRRKGNTIVSDISILRSKMKDFHQTELKRLDVLAGVYSGATADLDTTMPYCDLTSTGLILDQGRHIRLLNLIGQGQDYNQRIGRVVYNAYITIRGVIWPRRNGAPAPNLATSANCTCRTVLVWDKQPNKLTPLLEEIFVPVSDGVLTIFNATCQLNLNYRERFKILYDRTVTLPARGVNGEYGNMDSGVKKIKIHKKIKRRTIYTDDSGTAIINGGLYIITLGDANTQETSAPAYTNGGQLAFYSRLRYADS